MTQWPELFNALAEPFHPEDVKERTGTGRKFRYVTARTVMNRCDDVLGPENWWDEYTPLEHSVLCRLTIRLPDGSTLTKCDAGGYAGMSDSGDDDKSGYSDAYKRAAVKFGISRYLYGDGHATFPTDPATAEAPAAPPTTPSPAKPDRPTRTYWQLVMDATNRRNTLHEESISPSDTHWMLAVLADREGKAKLPESDHANATLKAAETLDPAWVLKKLTEFVGRKVTPRHLDSLYHFERTDKPLDPKVTLEQFLDFETGDSGRGTAAGALRFLTSRLSKSHPKFEAKFADPDTRQEVLRALREYLDQNPCTLPPITQEKPR